MPPHRTNVRGGGYLLTYKKNPLKNVLFKNINELNLTLILTLGVLFIVFSGFTSYALFIDSQTSSKNISVSFPSTGTSTSFSYTGSCQTYTVSNTGYYLLEAWGAQGGTFSGYTSNAKGGYTSGIIKLSKGENLYVCVGQAGSQSSSQTFNGGGKGGSASSGSGASGGGATDIRLVNGSSWSDTTGLNSRIMVAAGGGGIPTTDYNSGGGNSSAGGLLGTYGGYYAGHGDKGQYGKGATQTSGGSAGSNIYDATGTASAGSFGIGGANNTVSSYLGAGGGGGGYYGGGAGGGTKSGGSGNGAGGGSSFISGYAGVNAITSSTSRTHTYNTLHYSGKNFINSSMTPATNTGNGKAKITFLSSVKPKRTNKTLDGVRYIKDCINGSNTAYTSNHWIELQAIYNGTNVAKGKTATGTATISNASYITNGDITSSNYADITSGTQCITIDLGQEYDLDEIAVWHYWSDGRTYNNNVTYVSSDNSNWITVMNKTVAETSQGKRVSAYVGPLMNQIKSQVKTTNINYKYINGANVTINGVNYNNNDNGLFLFSGTDDNGGSNPIYYYRGNVTNNNVLFANLCWKIVRTTSTGGIKLIYNGEPTDGTCNNTETASQYGTSSYNDWDELFDQAGYMYGENNDEYFGSNKVDKWFTYSNNVTYDSSTNAYTLHVPLDSWKWSTERTEIANYGYHYTCFDSNPCTILHYVMFFKNASWIYYLDLTGGDTLETLKDSYFSNTVDSAIKTKVDSFYETYLTNYASHLENTIFCNDRNFETGPLSSEYATGMGDSFFGGIQRLNIKYSPSLKCTRQNDKFSLSTSNGGTSGYGNNALKYPIALLTSDEVQMAGGKYATSNINYYLYNNESYWLMTPDGWHGSSYPTLTMLYVGKGAVYDYSPTYAFGVRPVISLKSGIQFSGGNGTVNMPYIISE